MLLVLDGWGTELVGRDRGGGGAGVGAFIRREILTRIVLLSLGLRSFGRYKA